MAPVPRNAERLVGSPRRQLKPALEEATPLADRGFLVHLQITYRTSISTVLKLNCRHLDHHDHQGQCLRPGHIAMADGAKVRGPMLRVPP